MTLPHRVATLVLVLPTWIALILSGGPLCPMSGSHTARGDGAANHIASADHGASMSNAHGAGDRSLSQHGGHAGAATSVDGAVRSGDMSAAPSSRHHGHETGGGACASQVACSAAVVARLRPLLSEPELPSRRLADATSARPASVSAAPELPPPRA